MGLAQTFEFEYQSTEEIQSFINNLNKTVRLQFEKDLWTVSEFEGCKMMFEIRIVSKGLYCHRSGDYFSFLGYFLEQLSGVFGAVTIEDV
ncbi:hypothetical protein K6Q96_09510 [Grimontia kaedaensis]|uniref:Uncharacterized protein n=1 Tax=Grimontia kaedaensis TaxID=2872157 RepID=A0ABY4WNS9_9GAMM|nr:hypothetical protein [Grimontia kaedaensis]USH01173.1 hypothetical protein K6Q96_09510 [Grimontia kaedaensis]